MSMCMSAMQAEAQLMHSLLERRPAVEAVNNMQHPVA